MISDTNKKLYDIVISLKNGKDIVKFQYIAMFNYIRYTLISYYQSKSFIRNNIQDIVQDTLLLIIKTERTFNVNYITRQLRMMIIDILNSKKYQQVYTEMPVGIFSDDVDDVDDVEEV